MAVGFLRRSIRGEVAIVAIRPVLKTRESPAPPYAPSDKNVELHVFVQMWSCQKCGVSAPRPRKWRFPALSTPHFLAPKETQASRGPWGFFSTACLSGVALV